jgi:hypoxanthine phosphoribosyltransferase
VACRRGAVDISMYRDDLGLRDGVSALQGTDLPMDIDRWDVVLVDDVQHTGRTARAALEAVDAWDIRWAEGIDENVERIKATVRAALGKAVPPAPREYPEGREA